jgi:hypothetical protein
MERYQKIKEELAVIAKTLEAFPDSLKEKVFDVLMSAYSGQTAEVVKQVDGPKVSGNLPPSPPKSKASKPSPKKSESYHLDKNLNLRGDGKKVPSFSDFIGQKKPKSSADFNAVAVYYLSKHSSIASVTLDHIYTCYAEAKRKPAGFFKQSIIDTKNKQGFLDLDEAGVVSIPHRGVMHVEHDLPPKDKGVKK